MQKIDTSRLQGLARAYCQSAVLYTAIDLELFTHVAHGADTEAKLATALNIPPLQVSRLVTATLALQLLELHDGTLHNAPDTARFLVNGQPDYAADWLTFTRGDVGNWFRLTDFLKEPFHPSTLGLYDTLTVDDARRYHAATYSIGTGSARRFMRGTDLSTRRKLLDLGGGTGAYSIKAVQTYPNLHAIVLDLPPVIEVTKEYISSAGVADRVSVLPGDFTRTPFPNDVDVVLMASNLPLYSGPVIRSIVQKTFDALVPGGEFHLLGEMLRDDRTGPLDAAMWGMNEALSRSEGKCHTISDCIGYLRDAGFFQVRDNPFVPGFLHHVSGTKPLPDHVSMTTV